MTTASVYVARLVQRAGGTMREADVIAALTPWCGPLEAAAMLRLAAIVAPSRSATGIVRERAA
jgi:hypothetical protein